MAVKNVEIKIKRLHPDARIPRIGTNHSAGFDFYSIEEYELKPHETYPIKTGIALEVPEGMVLHIWDRSGLGMRGMTIYGGVIDSDYRGEIKAILHNGSDEAKKVNKGDRVCQGVLVDYYKPIFKEVENLSDTERGEGWNHSTGL